MKPKFPLTQNFEQLPDELPLYPLENALLPGGELPLELSEPNDLALFLRALKTDQLIGMVQHKEGEQADNLYEIGCAGRIRQYRERKDGRLNIMLTGLCRYRIVEEKLQEEGYKIARVDWSSYKSDYEAEAVESVVINEFKARLRHYFEQHNMQVDWNVLDKLPIEQIVNNLVLVMNLNIDSKQQLLEAITVTDRIKLFSTLLEQMAEPIRAPTTEDKIVN